MEYYKQISRHLENNDLPSIVTLWEEYCYGDEIDTKELIKILIILKNSHLASSFGVYVENILPLWESLPETDAKHDIFRIVIDMQTREDEDLRVKVYEYLKKYYGDQEHFNQKIKLIRLLDSPSFRYAISNYELLTHLKVGNFVFHTGGWGVGEILEVSLIREQLSLEFDYVAGRKELSFKNAFKTLIPLPNTHFLAQRFGNPDALEEKAKKNPVDVIHMLLKDLGPKNAQEIKDELCELVIPENEWAKWWQNARSKLKKDTLVEVPNSLKDSFRLRETEISHEERLEKALKNRPSIKDLIEMVYAFLRDFPGCLKKEEFKQSLFQKLSDILTHEELTDAQELQLHFFLEDLSPEKESKAIKQLIEGFSNFIDIYKAISVITFKKRFLQAIKAYRSDWIKVYDVLFLHLDHNPIREMVVNELLSANEKDLVLKNLHELMQNPLKSPGGFLWYFSQIMHKKCTLPFADKEGRIKFLEAFFVLLYQLEQRAENRELVKKMQSIVSSKRYAMIRQIFQHASKKQLKEFLLLATKCEILAGHDIKILRSLAEVVDPSLAQESEQESENENVIWTTKEGYQKIKERIHQIATVETVDNAKEIEVARSHGDLRENSEYKFALERRQRLQSELKLLSDQLNRARILTNDDIDLSSIGVGSIVEFESDKGENILYTFLGPWDSDTEKNILSFQSKIAQSLKGLKIGDQCEIQDKKWTVKSIKSVFDK